MGQFDSPTEAALARLKSESLSSSPVEEKVDKIITLGGIILEAIGINGASGATRFFTTLKSLAANKDEGNLIYFGEALIDDIRRLYRLHEELKQRFDERINSPEFNAVVANATLYITRTNVESRLRRLAHLIVNGVKENDLEPESLDDMMRAAVELTEHDISILKSIYEMQNEMFSKKSMNQQQAQRINGLGRKWQDWWRQNLQSHQGTNGMAFNSSCTRLQAAGLIASIGAKSISESPTTSDYELLLEGKNFYERLQEIAVQQ
ncbi:MAG: hypothetical protein ABR991_05930 [Terracidiphilus sp.]|jgi:hypothetical protein